MSKPGYICPSACVCAVVLTLLSSCKTLESVDEQMSATVGRTEMPTSLSGIPLPESPPDRDTYRSVGFDSRADWVAAALSIGEAREDQSVADRSGETEPGTYRLPKVRTDDMFDTISSGDAQLAFMIGGVHPGPYRASVLMSYARARRIVGAHPWLKDARTAHLHPAVLADALKDIEAHNVLWGSLIEGDGTRPTVWPSINIGNRYSAEEVARLKRDAVKVVSRSSLPHWAIILSQLFRASPDAVNLYITSDPERADIIHVPTGDSYGVTGSDLTVSRETLAQLEVRMPGYEPCPVRLTEPGPQDVYRCDLSPRPTGSADRVNP